VQEKNYLSNLTLLYVEDDLVINEALKMFFKPRVKSLYVALNGEEGLELYKKYTPDIVVSDINMPKMNGIDMSEKIKEIDNEIPIILITAFSDANFMMQAISVGVERYLLKPVDLAKLNEALFTVSFNLINKQIAEQAKEDKKLVETLNSFLEFSPNPIIIYENDKVQFVNNRFLELSKTDKESLINSNFDMNSLFQNRAGCISSIDKLRLNYKENKVSIKGEFGRRVLHILHNEVSTLGGHIFDMYTFNDITVNEYQKLKIENYNFRLEKFAKNINKTRNKNLSIENTNEIVEEAKDIEKEKRLLSNQEESVLKKSRMNKAFNAKDYANEIDDYILEDIHELGTIEDEIGDYYNAPKI